MSDLVKYKDSRFAHRVLRFLIIGRIKCLDFDQKDLPVTKKPPDFQQTIAFILLEIEKNRIFAALFKKQRWKNVMRRSSF